MLSITRHVDYQHLVKTQHIMEPLDSTQYLRWKKNTGFLYKQLQTSSLLWPSLSIEWLPDVDHSNQDFNQHRLVLGSFSSGFNKFESLQVCSVDIPTGTDLNHSKDIKDFNFDTNTNEFIYNKSIPFTKSKRDPENQNGDVTPSNSLTINQRIPHIGDINRIKHMPSNPDILATSSNSGQIRIFDRTKKSNTFLDSDFDDSKIVDDIDGDNLNDISDILLLHHDTESWTLDWNPIIPKTLATGANDGIIAIWDLEKQFTKPQKLEFSITNKKKFATCTIKNPITSVTKHDFGVNEIAWIPDHNSLLASIGEDGYYKLTDIRTPNANVLEINVTMDNNPLNCLDINPNETFQFVTGSDSGSMFIYDIRSIASPLKNVPNACSGSLTTTKFSPFLLPTKNSSQTTVVSSAGSDGVVRLWDISNTENDPLLFVHGGHLLEVNDISWSLSKPALLVSCSADNSVHIWEPNL